MEELVSQIMAIIGPAIITAIGIIVTWGLNELRRWVSTKTKNEVVTTAFKSLNQITQSAVLRAEQAMKRAGADGKITKEEAVKIKNIVFKDIKNQIPKNSEKILKKAINNIDDLVDSKIEETVYLMKQRQKRR